MLFNAIKTPDLEKLEYPFSYITFGWEDYNGKNSFVGLPDEKPIKDIGSFPKNILEYYWVHEGENDIEPWKLLCKISTLKGDIYAYYTAWCDYTGFDCQGGMTLTVSKSIFNLYEKALDDFDKEQLKEDIKNLKK
jgi:hypothetical protein